jgi:hypothetical protein
VGNTARNVLYDSHHEVSEVPGKHDPASATLRVASNDAEPDFLFLGWRLERE